MTSFLTGRRAVKAATLLLVAGAGVAVYAQLKGPSSSQSAYLLPTVPLVKTTAVLTVGDSIGSYRMVGIPDGLGAFDNGDGTLTLLMNHELLVNQGVARAHGSIGAFVSKWIIEKSTMHVISGGDLMQQVFLWNTTTQASNPTSSPYAFARFCSGDLPEVSAFYDAKTGLGTQQRIYMHGEEGGNGHQQATVVTGPDAGKSYELGKFNLTTNHPGGAPTGIGNWENALANPYPQVHTLVIGNSDGGTGIMNNALAVYWGTKQSSGTEADKAGLTNGTLKFVNVAGNTAEINNSTNRTTSITSGLRFALSSTSSTTFSRPEDGQWNPFNPAEFYFVTTDQLDQVTDGTGAQIGRTRLWRLTFDDVTNPDLGGKIDLLIDGRVVDGVRVNMFDNITVNRKTGQLVLQEDVGINTPHNGKMWLYDPATDELKIVAKHDPARFGDLGPIAATPPFTNDEESSGIIDMSHILGLGFYLTSDQAHYAINSTTPNGFSNPNELVEGGQLLLAFIPFPVAENKDQCKDSGWQGRFRVNGTTFKNQGDCVSYTNNGK